MMAESSEELMCKCWFGTGGRVLRHQKLFCDDELPATEYENPLGAGIMMTQPSQYHTVQKPYNLNIIIYNLQI